MCVMRMLLAAMQCQGKASDLFGLVVSSGIPLLTNKCGPRIGSQASTLREASKSLSLAAEYRSEKPHLHMFLLLHISAIEK